MAASVTIKEHTTTSKPNAHVVYVAEVALSESVFRIERRYSEVRRLLHLFAMANQHSQMPIVFRSSWYEIYQSQL